MSKQHFQSLLSTFGKSVGLPDLALDDNGLCTLTFDDHAVNIHYHDHGSNLILFAPVGPLPPKDTPAREEALLALMEANLFWGGTGGGTLAVESGGDGVVLQRQTRADIEQSAFEKLLEQFVDLTEFWTEQVAGFAAGAGSSTDAPTPPDGPGVPGMRV